MLAAVSRDRRRRSARIAIGEVSPAWKSVASATAASRLSRPAGSVGRVRDALAEAQERRAQRGAGTATAGIRNATGRAMTAVGDRSQRDSRAASAAAPTGRPSRRRIAVEEAGQAPGVDPRPEHPEHGRQERQGIEDRGRRRRSSRRSRRSEAPPAGTGAARTARSRRPARRTRRPCRSSRRSSRRPGDGPAAAELLAEAADHEQRVVDREGQPEHRRDVLDVDRELGRPGRRGRRRRASSGSPGRRRGGACPAATTEAKTASRIRSGERDRDRLGLDELLLGLVGLVLGERADAGELERGAGRLVDQRADLGHLVGRLPRR